MAPTQEGTYQLQAEYTEWGVTYKSNEVPFRSKVIHLNDYSWTQIQQIIASGQAPVKFAECFENGCCKEVHLAAGETEEPYNDDSYGWETAIAEQDIYVNILGFSHDEPVEGDPLRPTVTFGMAVAEAIKDDSGEVSNFKANQRTDDVTYNGQSSEWIGNHGRGILGEYVQVDLERGNHRGQPTIKMFLDTVYDQCLPEELKNVIIPVYKQTALPNGWQDFKEIVTTTPKLFLFSVVEATGEWGMNSDNTFKEGEYREDFTSNTSYGSVRSYEGEGSQYEYFSIVNDQTNLLPLRYRLSRSYSWWMRSPDFYNGYCYSRKNGYVSGTYPNFGNKISFNFCIG